jgi:hypothetical protein
MTTTIAEIKTADLNTTTEQGPSSLTARLVGSAETDAKKDLDVYLAAVHSAVTEAQIDEVVIDLRALEFMNSSCFKSFVSWVGLLHDTPVSAQYKVRFLSDAKKHWQSRSLNALACFAIDLVQIEVS